MTRLFEKILVATDGSDNNQPAVNKAIEIARVCGSTLYALYVIDETPFKTAQVEVLTDDVYREMQSEGDKAIEQVKQLAGEMKVETAVLYGKPAPVINTFATERGVDLIVVGSKGKSGFERLILGSVAESVIRLAGCMVLVVKSK